MKIALGVEYSGENFHGWQLQQDGVRTVQDSLEQAISQVAAHPVRVFCAGRTDTGVHAFGQVVHFESDAHRTERQWLLGINVNLPDDVSVTWVQPVDEEFHARFSAVSRSYRYYIWNRPTRSSLLTGKVNWIHHSLDHELMHEAAQALLGTHDFSSYRALQCQAKSPIKTLHRLDVQRDGDMIVLSLQANAFLHHMVRNIAGVLIAIGKQEQPVGWAAEVLALRDRRLGGVTAAPDGLYFEAVEYPEHFDIPKVSCPPLL
ncbi:MAG: tRNA pseudouridine(38-40) synthase TruA [Chromatiales bacterium]|jgi:tRNA pseudouridine38-40 synthase